MCYFWCLPRNFQSNILDSIFWVNWADGLQLCCLNDFSRFPIRFLSSDIYWFFCLSTCLSTYSHNFKHFKVFFFFSKKKKNCFKWLLKKSIWGRHSGLMLSALVSESSSWASSPFKRHSVVFFDKTFTFTLIVRLSIQMYKLVLKNLMLGVTVQWSSFQTREQWKYSLSLRNQREGLAGHLALMQT